MTTCNIQSLIFYQNVTPYLHLALSACNVHLKNTFYWTKIPQPNEVLVKPVLSDYIKQDIFLAFSDRQLLIAA